MNGPKVTFRLPRKRTNPRLNRITPPPTRLARQLALAHLIERLVESGELENYAEAARRLEITRARMSQVMNLLTLSPGRQEEILSGTRDISERRLRLVSRKIIWSQQPRS